MRTMRNLRAKLKSHISLSVSRGGRRLLGPVPGIRFSASESSSRCSFYFKTLICADAVGSLHIAATAMCSTAPEVLEVGAMMMMAAAPLDSFLWQARMHVIAPVHLCYRNLPLSLLHLHGQAAGQPVATDAAARHSCRIAPHCSAVNSFSVVQVEA